MNKVNESLLYTRPQLQVFSVAAERGFLLSEGAGYPGENPDFNDYGEF